MRKILSLCLLVGIVSTIVSSVFAISMKSALPEAKESVKIEYPVGEDFSKLKTLIEANFSPSNGGYRYNCIANNTLCSNYRYTSIIEKAIKLIVLQSYEGNEQFYFKLFSKNSVYDNAVLMNTNSNKAIKIILDSVPRGSTIPDWKSLGFGNSIGGGLLDASFGVDFTENMNSSTMLGAIDQKIKDMKRNKCSSIIDRNTTNSINDCYSNDLSNKYLPTQEELYAEMVYLNRGSVKIGTLKDEIEYKVEYIENNREILNLLDQENISVNENSIESPIIEKLDKSEIDSILNSSSIEGPIQYTIIAIEYSDMECPFCIKQYNDTKLQKALKDKYGDTVAFAYKNNRGVNHPGTEIKALSILCAKKIAGDTAYIAFHKAIMNETNNGNIYPVSKLAETASSLSIDLDKWQTCIDTKATLSQFESETSEAKKYNMGGTPGTLLLNVKSGQYAIVEGAYPIMTFTQKIDSLLTYKPISTVRVNPDFTKIKTNTGDLIPSSYTLRYKKDSYTLEEANTELEKKDKSNEEFLVTNDGQVGEIPCKKYTAYLVRSQCTMAVSSLMNIKTGLAAHSIDMGGDFPDNIDKLKGVYIMQFPQGFTDNFSYKSTKNSRGESDYEIRYIGHIGENTTGSGEVTNTKDYKAMIGGAIVPEIPAIFAHIPSDSMVLYVRNPANLIDLLNQKSNTSQRLSGIDASESIRNLMKTFFELEKFEQIEKNLKHDLAIVVNNLDATAPDIIIILSESDREALSPTGKARVVGSKDGYIFIASSKESLEKLTNLTSEKSMSKAPDFQYVWWKKSALVKDALMFVGDEFFAKMLTLETYLTHYRKYRDYSRLTSLQELAWAYTDAFGKAPTGFGELTGLGLSTLTGEVLGEYSIVDGMVTHRNIGTLKSVKTLPEARYDLSKISRTEFEDYKYNVLQYRDIWRASLDPMGIVINRYGDGMEVDFFMTPIPSSPDKDLMQMQKMFEGTTKDSLSFVTNSQIRMGLVSFVLGFDPQKLQTKIKSNEEIGRGFEEFSKEILDGKNIFDYLGGEFAWSLGSLDPDIFEGWNVEKVDTYISVQVANEAKGKELIEMLKKKFIGEMSRGGSSTESSIFSMLAKPLIEDYKGKKIYYVEAIPVPFVGKIGLAYTFVDDFFMMGLNRSTIRHVIDTAVSGDIDKKNLVSTESFEKGTFFATLFDGVRSSTELKKLYEKNQSTIPRYFGDIFRSESTMTPLIASYYATEDRSRRLGKKPVSFHYELGSLSLSGMGDNLIVKIDQNKLSNLSGSTLEMWESIRKDSIFPPAIFAEQGISLGAFLAYPRIGDIISINMLVQLDSALGGTESLLRNVTFGMNMGNDEIGFRLRVFRQKEGSKGVASIGASSDMMMIGGVVVLLIVLGGVVWFIIRRRPSSSITVTPSIPNTDRTVTESPVIVSSLILPQDTPSVSVSILEPSIIVVPSVLPTEIIAPVSAPITLPTVPPSIEIPVTPVIVPVEPASHPVVDTTPLIQDVSIETK